MPTDLAALKEKLTSRGIHITQGEGLLVRGPTRALFTTREWHLSDRNGQWYSYPVTKLTKRFLVTVNWVLEYQSASDLEFGPEGLEVLLDIWHEILAQRRQAA